jgi:murein L,D-transpeptidase YafK
VDGRPPLNGKALGGHKVKVRIALLALVAVSGGCSKAAGAAPVCSASDVRIVVHLKEHVLLLCEKDKVVDTFGVRLGSGGIGKSREGDKKTPVGEYDLGEPRPSKSFGTFIPIGYPTAEQQKVGLTGGAVGVHGPHRWISWLGSLVNTFDSSDGCVGVATDGEIERISKWVRTASAKRIELR